MAMATTPLTSTPSSSSSSHRKARTQLLLPTSSRHNGVTTTPAPPAIPPAASSKSEESSRFKFSRLLHFHEFQQHQHSPAPHRKDQNQTQQPPVPQQQQQQGPHHRHHSIFSAKQYSPAARFRRGGFLGFLQSHYPVFHRHHGQHSSATAETKEVSLLRERRRPTAAVSPRSPAGSFMSSLYGGTGVNKSPYTTMHSTYNVTISDFRAHATIASTRSGGLPTKVTDVVFEGRGGQGCREVSLATTSASAPTTPYVTASGAPVQDPFNMTPNLTSTSAGGVPALASSHGGVSNGFMTSLRSLNTVSTLADPSARTSSSTTTASASTAPTSPTLGPSTNSSPSRQPHPRKLSLGQVSMLGRAHGQERLPESSSKNALKGWGAAAAMKLGFMNLKKKRPMPSHYLSLPIGGLTSSSAGPNGMYMLHSEDLSVTEFAKLAGITILPEEDDTVAAYEESLINNEGNSGTAQNQISEPLRKCAGGAGNEGGGGGSASGSAGNTLSSDRNLTLGSSASSNGSLRRSSSKTLDITASYPSEPITIPGRSADTVAAQSDLTREFSSSAPTHAFKDTYSFKPARATEDGPLIDQGACQPRRHSSSPLGSQPPLRSGSGSQVPHPMSLSSSDASLKRMDQKSKVSKEPIQLSRELGRRRSFSSLTAIAIELDSEPESGYNGVKESSSHDQIPQLRTQRQSPSRSSNNILHPLPILLEPSNPTQQSSSGPVYIPQPASHSVAMHALQSSRNRGANGLGHHQSNLRSGPPNSSRTRSPSPSPLSHQIEMSDSDGVDSPPEDDDEEPDWPKIRTHCGVRSGSLSVSPLSNSPPPVSRNQARSYMHGTPAGVSGAHGSEVHIKKSTPRPPPLQTIPPKHLPPPNFAPRRVFTPGTKVGRFTLVPAHADEDMAPGDDGQPPLQRRASVGTSLELYGPVNHARHTNGSVSDADEGSTRARTETGIRTMSPNGTLLSTGEENVVFFQRKRVRRRQHPQLQEQLRPPASY
ncbi:hypothetical protein BGZ68_007864 [Mortierella alpina]|nr:hypothetical protein BGZ68_007864 [Mortierella alpina]